MNPATPSAGGTLLPPGEPALVRAVILNFCRPQLTIRCVKSLQRQERVRLDVAVVDNWSNGAQLEELRKGLPPGPALIENKVNLGYSAGNNSGLRAKPSSAAFSLILNNDTVMNDPRTVSLMVDALERNPAYAACSPLIRDEGIGVSPEASIQVRRIPNFWELLIVASGILRRLPGLRRVDQRQVYADKRPFELGAVIPCETINGACFLIRNSVLEAIGYLDEGTFLYCEEIILGFQLRARGLGCALVTQSVVDHQQGSSAGRNASGSTLRGIARRMRSEAYFAKTYLGAGAPKLILLWLVGGADALCKVVLGAFRRSK